ncbi:asparaginase [Bailinhaonella thermotolerans]|uniref:Asparaginase n=1 Tax=Bailinhaonella thermotolerans TaxID=1070861 RepID=A0A3A4BHV5_9ACTN|nr:asparaginase [Bailinhaonella thermotolerans]RJL30842.1 asparaginase [Bailinhaonella thermotolerans]
MIIEVVRSGFVESRHRVRAIGLGASGDRVIEYGEAGALVSPRSAMKPLQALGMLRAGLQLDGELLALAAASHSGEDFHVEGVLKILGSAGLTEDALQCPVDLPLDPEVANRLLASGGRPSRLRMNCSGKHAAMLLTCVANDWPLESYLDPAHPLQRVIRQTVEDLTGQRIAATGVDGCGAPLFVVSLSAVAHAFRDLVLAEEGTPERRVADAMRAHPEWTSGTTRPEAALMRALPGLLLKSGAEGVDVFAHADGRAGAIKVEDGAVRARVPATVALLRDLDFDAPELAELAAPAILGGGRPVGHVSAQTLTQGRP